MDGHNFFLSLIPHRQSIYQQRISKEVKELLWHLYEEKQFVIVGEKCRHEHVYDLS